MAWRSLRDGSFGISSNCRITLVSGPKTSPEASRASRAIYEAVLRAKYLDRQTVEEIAAARGETMKAVESLLSRARQAFREAYEADHE